MGPGPTLAAVRHAVGMALRPPAPRRVLAAVLLLPALSGCASDPPTVSPSGVDMLEIPTPSPDPGDFATTIDNPWLPLLPGAEWVYESTDGETTTVTVTDQTREVAGVTTTVVRDVVTDEDGDVVGETSDWFAQDRAGNVWWFGSAGSWEAGVDGAEAGIAMLARPRRGDGYEQQHAPGEAEDRATILSLEESLQVGSESYDEVLVTEDTTPLEPDLVEQRHYVRGAGLVLEETVSGGSGQAELVGFTAGEAAR